MLKNLSFLLIIVSVMQTNTITNIFHKKRNSVTVETKNGVFKIPVHETTTIESVKQQLRHLEGTPIIDQEIKKKSILWPFQPKLSNHKKIQGKRLSMTLKKRKVTH